MKRTYTEEEIAHALAALQVNGGNQSKTARQLGIERTTLLRWAGGTRRRAKTGEGSAKRAKLAQEETSRAVLQWKAMREAAQAQAMKEIPNLRGKDAALVAAISEDKINLAEGKPTSRTESVKVSYTRPKSLRTSALTVLEGGQSKAVS